MVPLSDNSNNSENPKVDSERSRITPHRRTKSTERFAALSRNAPSTVRPVSTLRHGKSDDTTPRDGLMHAVQQNRKAKKAAAKNEEEYIAAGLFGESSSGFNIPSEKKSQRPENESRFKPGRVKKWVIASCIVLVVGIAGAISADYAFGADKVHWGITVEGVDVGGLSKEEATNKLQIALDARLSVAKIQGKPDASAEARLAEKAVSFEEAEGEEAAAEEAAPEESAEASQEPSITWAYAASDLGASVDASQAIEEAYALDKVSSVADIFPSALAKINSWIGKTDLSVTLDFDEKKLNEALQPINDTIGITMVNSNLDVNEEGVFSVRSGQIGMAVDLEQFTSKAQEVILANSETVFDIPLRNVAMGVNDDGAQKLADKLNIALASPITFEYETHTWSLEAPLMGPWITTSVEGEDTTTTLKASVDPAKAYEGLQQLMGEISYGSAKNAYIDVSSGTPAIVGGEKGTGPDLMAAAANLQKIIVDGEGGRRVVCGSGEVEPAVTADDVSKLGITELIASFELSYGAAEGTNREFNIERALSKLNNSTVAPGEKWHWNDVVGRCDDTTGYKEAGAISGENEFIQASGGGICNVATGVFNVAYEAGLPINERANHSLYLDHYPLGRDAAVSWEYPTLVFTNDTEAHILVTAKFDGKKMYLSIWGKNAKRKVDSRNGDWVEMGSGGKSITNYRTVTAADGKVLRTDTFYSYFPPTKKEEEPAT